MPGSLRLPTLNFGLRSANKKNLPFSFHDDFSTIKGNWTGDTWAISGGNCYNSPDILTNLILNGAFDSDASNWTLGSSATLASVAGGQNGNCLQITNGAAAQGFAYQSVSTSSGLLLEVDICHKSGTAGGVIRLGTAYNASDIYTSPTYADPDWARKICTSFALGNTTYLRLLVGSSSASRTTLWDTIRFGQIPIARTMRLLYGYSQYGEAYASWTVPAGLMGGVWMCVDNPTNPQNGLFAVCNFPSVSGFLMVGKLLNGTVSILETTGITYGDGKIVKLKRVGTTNVFKAYYGAYGSEVQIGTDKTISDSTIINNAYHGLFSSGPSALSSDFWYNSSVL